MTLNIFCVYKKNIALCFQKGTQGQCSPHWWPSSRWQSPPRVSDWCRYTAPRPSAGHIHVLSPGCASVLKVKDGAGPGQNDNKQPESQPLGREIPSGGCRVTQEWQKSDPFTTERGRGTTWRRGRERGRQPPLLVKGWQPAHTVRGRLYYTGRREKPLQAWVIKSKNCKTAKLFVMH